MNRFSCGVSIAILLSATALAQNINIPYERFVLPNGLQVFLHQDKSIPVVALNLWYNVGSANEKPGRTGFAHLFEHIMFEGSKNVPEGAFDNWLEAAGGSNNAGTSSDYTVYYEEAPRNALELPLFLESDRLGYLLATMSPAKVDGQRDVVKNERRQSYENRPYGMASIIIDENVFPPNHPYHWPTIGSMEDLSAASYEDVVEFFKRYYVPNNASLAIAGDIDPAATRALVEKWFKEIPRGGQPPPIDAPTVVLTSERRVVSEDNVQLPRLYMVWVTPRSYAPGDAEMDVMASILSGGKNSRLYKRLVHDLQIAQDVSAFQESGQLVSKFNIIATAREGHTLPELERVIQEEIDRIKNEPPTQREVQRAVNQFEASFLDRLEHINVKAQLLNSYYMNTGNPDYANEDLSRYKAVDTTDIRSMAQTYLRDNGRFILSIVPTGKRNLAAGEKGGVR
jgi:zinc protease